MYVRIKDINKKNEAKNICLYLRLYVCIYVSYFKFFTKRTPKNYINIGFKKFSELRQLFVLN